MTTATFFSKPHRSMYLGALKRNMPLGIFYGVLMTALFPLMYIVTLLTTNHTIDSRWMHSELQRTLYGFGAVYTTASGIAMILICAVMPIVFGVVGFSYLHSRKSTDVYHALPIKRQSLFTANYLAGLTLLWIPIITSFGVILIAGGLNAGALGSTYSVARILWTMCIWLVSVSTIYTITAAVAVLSGTSFDSVLYALALCGMYPILLMLAKSTMQDVLVGFSGNWATGLINETNMVSLSPFTLPIFHMASYGGTYDYTNMVHSEGYWFNLVAVFAWAAVTVALFFITNQLYAHRKSELAGCTRPSSFLSKIVQYALVFASGTLFGILLGQSFSSKLVYILGVLIGGGIAYAAYEAVVARGFKTFPKAFIHMGISVGLTLAFMCVFLTGGLGYETRVPQLTEIQSVIIDYNGRYDGREYYATEEEAISAYREVTGDTTKQSSYDLVYGVSLSSPQGIEIVRGFHEASIEEQRALKYTRDSNLTDRSNFRANIIYTLKDGSRISRSYGESSNEKAKLLGALEDLDEFRQQTNPAFLLEAGELKNITLADRLGKTTDASLTAMQQEGLITALRKDANNETLEDLTAETYPTVGYIELVGDVSKHPQGKLWPRDGAYILITEGYTSTIKWLQENNLYAATQVDKTKLATAMVYENSKGNNWFREFDSDNSFFTFTPSRHLWGNDRFKENEDTLLVDDAALVQQLFEKGKNYGSNTAGYYVQFQVESMRESIRLYLAQEDVPPQLQTLIDTAAPWVLTENEAEELTD